MKPIKLSRSVEHLSHKMATEIVCAAKVSFVDTSLINILKQFVSDDLDEEIGMFAGRNLQHYELPELRTDARELLDLVPIL